MPTRNAPAPSEIEGLERQMWEDWKNGHYSAMGKRMWPDAVVLSPGGITDPAGAIAAMERGDYRVDDVSLEDVRVNVLAPTVATISYRVRVIGSRGGQPIGSVVSGSVWVERDGKWLTVLHSENPISGKHV